VRIRLALTLDVRRDHEAHEYRETDLSSSHERSDDTPPIGFTPRTLDPEEKK